MKQKVATTTTYFKHLLNILIEVMKKLEGHDFKLKKGDYLLLKKREVTFDSMIKSYIGVVRDYDGVNSKSGCVSKVYKIYHLSGNITELFNPHVFCWYKDGFMVLGDFEKREFGKDIYSDLYKMNKKEISQFKSRITKNKILKKLQ